MKYSVIWVGCAIGLTTASYVRNFGSDAGVLLRARTAPRLVARMNRQQVSKGKSSQQPIAPHAAVIADGPAKLSRKGPDQERATVTTDTYGQLISHGIKKPYVEGRLSGEASPHAANQPIAFHPLKAMSMGQRASAQVTVPHQGLGYLRATNSEGHKETIIVPGGTEKRIHATSKTPGGAEVFASVTRPGKINADAQR